MKVIESVTRHTEVQYNDDEHKYFLQNVTYRSATQIIHQFTNEFNTLERSRYMADRWGHTPEYWVKQWKDTNTDSLDRGNFLHNEREDYLYNRGFASVHGKFYHVFNINGGSSVYDDLGEGTYPEMKFWDHNWRIAGRADKPTIEIVNGVRYLHIDDYKTNKKLEDQSYYDGKEFRMMKGPLSHLMDCNLVHYQLQLSLYQFMGEYFNFKPGLRRIIHFPHEIEGLGKPDPKIIELPYLRSEVLLMLRHLKQQRWLN